MLLSTQRKVGIKNAVLVGLCIILLSACGFKLRGVNSIQLSQKAIYIESESPYGLLENSLKRAFESSGANLTNSLDEAEVLLKLHALEFTTQGTSRDATGRANEIILRANLAYELRTDLSRNEIPGNQFSADEAEVQAKPLSTMKVARSFYQNYRNPVSEQTLRKQTEQEVIEELVRRLTLQVNWQLNKSATSVE
ncbi:LPS assembly lipoprotein LptE [Aliikangiella marina]